MSNTQYDYDKLFLAYEEARADITAHFRKIIELQKELAIKDAEIESLKHTIRTTSSGLYEQVDSLKSELAEKDAVLKSALARITTTNSWLKRMSELRWKDKTYAPNFKKSVEMNDEFLQKYRGKE